MKLIHTLIVIVVGLLVLLVVAGIGGALWSRLNRRMREFLRVAGTYVLLIGFGVIFVAPFAWMLVTSIKVDDQIFTPKVLWLPSEPTVKERVVDDNGLVKESYVPIKAMPDGKRVAVIEQADSKTSRVRDADAGPSAPDKMVPTANLKDVPALAPQWHNYPDALNSFPFVRYTVNTLILCVLTMIGTVLSAALPAYGFARLRWRGREQMFFLLVATIMLPPQVTMLPVFLIFRWLHWTGTMLPLVVPAFFGSAFYIFLLRQFFLTIPQELSDAARIDGCNEMGILWRILAPIARPALATIALLSFTAAWMDFTGPLIYLHDERTYTLAVGLLAFLGRHGGEWSLLMAASTVMTIPMLVLFFFAQRTYIQGIALTGLKG